MSADLSCRVLRTLLPGLLLTTFAAAAQAGEPQLVRDLRPGTAQGQGAIDSRFRTARTASGILFFAASDPTHGLELWRTDGTPQGTFRLTDVCPGRCGSLPDFLEIAVFDGEVYFGADDGVSGRELWASGDMPGTARRVRDLCPGPCSGIPSQLAVIGDRLYFEALVPGGARGLWISDGSRQGTTLLRKLCHQFYDTTNCTYGGIVEAGGLALFQMNNSTLGIWRSDGTPEGTGPFTDVVGDFAKEASLVSTGGGAAFAWSDDALWWTDGTPAGTRRLKSAAELGITDPNILGIFVQSTIWKGMLFSIVGTALVRSDGTREGTFRIAELSPGLTGFAPGDDALFLVLGNGEIWRTGGTAETTGPAAAVPDEYVSAIGVVGNRVAVCIQYSDEPVVTELWMSDGTAAGTQRVEGGPAGCGAMASVTADHLALTGQYPFRGLWRTDGTAGGTSELHDFGTGPAASGPLEQLAWKGQLLFTAHTSEVGAPLFLSDGTSPGTHEVDPEVEVAESLAQAGNRVFFHALEVVHEDGYDWARSLGLWKTDGSAAGTVQVHPWGYFSSPMPVGNALFFAAARAFGYNGEPDMELFRSNGTRSGTGLVRNINVYTSESNFHHMCYGAPSDPGPGVELNGRLLFAADDGLHGRELWESTGTEVGTRMLRDIDPRRLDEPPPDACAAGRKHTGLGSDPRDFIRYRNGVLFTAADGEAGRELWWTDGTADGTRRVANIRPGKRGSEPHDLVLFRGRIWFVASSEGKGEELWQTDGTRQGTVRVRRLDVAALPAEARSLTAVGGRLFFVLSTEAAGPELWVSSGTAASTRRVRDLHPGPEGSYPQSLTAAHGLLVFAADDGVHGLEAWRSDGTAAGTFPLGDVNPGLDASAPGPFTPIAGGLVLSGADDGEHGRELWAYPVVP